MCAARHCKTIQPPPQTVQPPPTLRYDLGRSQFLWMNYLWCVGWNKPIRHRKVIAIYSGGCRLQKRVNGGQCILYGDCNERGREPTLSITLDTSAHSWAHDIISIDARKSIAALNIKRKSYIRVSRTWSESIFPKINDNPLPYYCIFCSWMAFIKANWFANVIDGNVDCKSSINKLIKIKCTIIVTSITSAGGLTQSSITCLW